MFFFGCQTMARKICAGEAKQMSFVLRMLLRYNLNRCIRPCIGWPLPVYGKGGRLPTGWEFPLLYIPHPKYYK
jgi:hypothetical protein